MQAYWLGNQPGHFGLKKTVLVKHRDALSDNEGFDKNIQAIPLRIHGAWDLQGGYISGAKTGLPKLLRGRLLIACIRDEA